jgi:taurine dioxygenase
VSGVIGAEVQGIDLAGPLSDDTVDGLRRTFNEHQVLFFRGQDLSAEQQIAFGRRFGELGTHPYVEANPQHPEVIDVVTEPDDRVNFGGGWHTDVTFLPEPDLGSILYAIETPPVGGDTLFASQLAAYDALSDTMKGLLDGLVGIHSAAPQYGGAGYSTQSTAIATKGAADAAASRVEHPVVITHPETGRKGLYVNPAFTIGITGMHRAESQALLRFLYRHATAEAMTCRFKWEPGSVAMWDNRSVQHYALHDYKGHRRRMRRITIRGTAPA